MHLPPTVSGFAFLPAYATVLTELRCAETRSPCTFQRFSHFSEGQLAYNSMSQDLVHYTDVSHEVLLHNLLQTFDEKLYLMFKILDRGKVSQKTS